MQLSPNFRLAEFHCRCTYPECKTTYVSDELVEGLEQLREHVGPLTITSGFRCEKHNKDVKGMRNSCHLLGLAADITSSIFRPREVEQAAKRVSIFSNGGIGDYSSWTHVDARGEPARWVG